MLLLSATEYNGATKKEAGSYTILLTCIKNVCIKKCISPAAFNRTLIEDFPHGYDFGSWRGGKIERPLNLLFREEELHRSRLTSLTKSKADCLYSNGPLVD